MYRFLFPERLTPGQEIILSPAESRHLSRVLRLKKGALVELFDGKGKQATATVLDTSSQRCCLHIESVRTSGDWFGIQVCFGIPKTPALDFMVRRGTELGIAGFQPLLTEHSIRPKSWNFERWEKVVVEVSKQCQALWVPQMFKPQALSEWLATRKKERSLVFCDEQQRRAQSNFAANPKGYDLLIGPEGGWSKQEATLLGSAAIPFGLGKNRLRAETAMFTATVLLKFHIGEL